MGKTCCKTNINEFDEVNKRLEFNDSIKLNFLNADEGAEFLTAPCDFFN